jgi:hypothetical protein
MTVLGPRKDPKLNYNVIMSDWGDLYYAYLENLNQ